jgi:hypothetical protein
MGEGGEGVDDEVRHEEVGGETHSRTPDSAGLLDDFLRCQRASCYTWRMFYEVHPACASS